MLLMTHQHLRMVQIALLLLAVLATVFGLIDYQRWNGLDLLALLFWTGFMFSLNQEPTN